MKEFKDEDGRQWTVAVDYDAIKSCRDLVKVDLYGFFAKADGDEDQAKFGHEANRVVSDPVLMIDTLFVLCRQQCEQRKMTDRDFGRLFKGDVLEAAGKALIGAVIDFFPARRQTILLATMKKSEALEAAVLAKVTQQIEDLNPMDLLKQIESQG